jgi:hypothetical protein
MTKLDYLSKFEVTDQPVSLEGRTAVLVGTGAMRQCGVFTRPWPFLWARQGTARVVYVPPFGRIYRDPLFLKTAMLFYKELVQEHQLM